MIGAASTSTAWALAAAGLFHLEAGQYLSLALPLGDQLRTGLALRVDGVERAIGPAALCHLGNSAVDLGKPGVDIGERMGLRIDPGDKCSGFGRDRPRRADPVAKCAATNWLYTPAALMAARPVTSMISTARDNRPRRRHWCARKATLTSFPSSIASESLANLLIEKGQNSLAFSECPLKLKAEQVDFDSAISRFESWRPSQPPGSLRRNFRLSEKWRHFRGLAGNGVRGAKPVAGSGRTGARGDEFWQVWDRWGGWD